MKVGRYEEAGERVHRGLAMHKTPEIPVGENHVPDYHWSGAVDHCIHVRITTNTRVRVTNRGTDVPPDRIDHASLSCSPN